MRARWVVGLPVALAACGARPAAEPPIAPAAEARPATAPDHVEVATPELRQPLLPPQAAHLLGLLPRRSVGAEQFLIDHPTFDGRGVLIGIMDSGIDGGVPGLHTTTTGDPKLLDLRDFSGEGHITLTRLDPSGDAVTVMGQTLHGYGRVRALAVGRAWGGALLEAPLGALPAADVNGDGDAVDTLAVVVARATDGWFLLADTDGDGSLAGESPVRDFAQNGDTFTYGPLTLAANFGPGTDTPALDLFFDTSGHGTHVAGIAAGHDLFGVAGFDGIAPGAQLLGLKIANDARGGISVTGSMVRAMNYAALYAERRGLPLVLNLSFGIGNEEGTGTPVIDSLIDAFALAHPDVVFVISAGNDGPGISTVGFPGSAPFALSACALFPGVFAEAPKASQPPADDVIGWWSARGGPYQKPDVCVPGVAFSNVPKWQTGEEVSGGTSMAAPQLAGIAALLQSAMLTDGPSADAARIGAALRATAQPIDGATWVDAGAGVPNVGAAWSWLQAGHRAGLFDVRAAPDGGNTGVTAAYRRNGLAAGDTIQQFTVTSEQGQPFARLLLASDAPWLRAPPELDFAGDPASIAVTYDPAALTQPGLYVGTVWARPESDTLAGAAFGLQSTIAVPFGLDAPVHARRYIPKGRSARFYLNVPTGAGGLSVQATVSDKEQAVSLYVFEPTGQPQRGEASIEIGGQRPATGEILVRAEDVVPGVYEVVLVAPPTRGVTADFTAALPPVGLAARAGDGVSVSNRLTRPLQATASLQPVGAGRSFALSGEGGAAVRSESLTVPLWARSVQLDVAFPRDVWRLVTDVGVSLWDSAGVFVSEGPLNYPSGRQVVSIEPAQHPVLQLELMPAFALPDAHTAWRADVTVVFLAERPLGTPATEPISLATRAATTVPWTTVPQEWLPAGMRAYGELTVASPGAPNATLRALMPAPAAIR